MGKYIGSTATVQPTQASAGGVYTLKDQLVYNAREQWPVGRDPYFNQTTLLLQGDVPYTRGRGAMTTPLAYNSDASSNNFLITPNGDVGPRPFSPYFGGNYSVYFGSGNYLSAASNAAFAPGTGDFTVEAWVYPDSAYTTFNYILGVAVTNGLVFYITGGNLVVRAYGSSDLLSSSTIPALNTWTHVAATRSGTTLRIFVNGVLTASTANSTNFAQAAAYIGNDSTNQAPWYGYISNFRFVKGTAVYTSNFTPSLTPVQNISGTSLLACQANRFIDNSTANSGLGWALTVTGTPRITDNSPFVSTDFTTGSAYFDGTGDYLFTPTNAAFAFGTGDISIEFWYYHTSRASTDTIFALPPVENINIYILTSGVLGYYNGSTSTNSSQTVPLNAWGHIAWVRASGTVKMYYNGAEVLSHSNTTNFTTNAQVYLGSNPGLTDPSNGYLADARVLKGTAVYTGAFTPPTNLLRTSGAASAASYPSTTNVNTSFAESATSLLTLQTRAPSQNISFLDSSPNEFLVTKNGNTTQGTFSPFSPTGWSGYFNGSARLSSASGNVIDFGANNFTVEMWVYLTSSSNNMMLLEGPSDNGFQLYVESGALKAGISGGSVALSYTLPSTFWNSWNHIAVVRSGTGANQAVMYLNGSSVSTNSLPSTSVTGFQIARTSGYTLYGYVSNVRIIKNQALFSGNFTPSINPLTTTSAGATGTNVASSITGTVSLLTCQSNRFIDNSGTVSSITVSSTSVQAFSPFAPANAVSPLVTGGSGYFDGTTDYLTVPDNAVLRLGTEAFTIEAWVYLTATTTYQEIIGPHNADAGWVFRVDNSTGLKAKFYTGTVELLGTITIPQNSWAHIAAVREGTGSNQFKIYVNGVLDITSTNSNNYTQTNTYYIGAQQNALSTTYLNGYISNLRIVKGTALYTANFTPPTTPLTAVSNTSLLLNFTNGAAVDATGRNVLESVGNVHTTRAQAKFDQLIGGSAIYFDGSSDYLIMPDIYTGQFLTGDFTVEYWDRHGTQQSTNYSTQVGNLSSGSFAGTWRFGTFTNTSGLVFAYHNGTSFVDVYFGSTAYNDNTWRHFAISRQSGTVRCFVDGIQIGSNQTITQSFNSSNRVIVGAEFATPTYFNGYIQNLRITKAARYTAGTGANANQMVFNGTNVLALPTAPFPRG